MLASLQGGRLFLHILNFRVLHFVAVPAFPFIVEVIGTMIVTNLMLGITRIAGGSIFYSRIMLRGRIRWSMKAPANSPYQGKRMGQAAQAD